MLGFFFNYFFSIILATVALLFSAFAYTQKKDVFFYLGLSFTVITMVAIGFNFDYLLYSVQEGNLMSLVILAALIISIVFLVLSKTTKSKLDDGVTDSFLDDIINADDEDWDAES